MLPGDVDGFRDDFLQLPSFKSMAEDEWYLSSSDLTPTPCDPLHLLDQSSCSQSPAFPLSAPTTTPTMLNPFDISCESSFGDDCHDAFLDFGYVGTSDLGLPAQFQGPNLSQIPEEGSTGFNPFEVAPFLSRPKLLRPLEANPPAGAQPTLFQKRAAALRRGGGAGDGRSEGEEEVDVDGSKGEGGTEEGGGGEEGKGKRKGVLPAKNLMAERRRRKKLNDRLYMLRSVVPKISKMDRASILGDAIDYLKELLQRINDLHNELESAPPGSALPATSNSVSFHPLTPTLPVLPNRVKEELSSSPMPSPRSQPARVEVRLREGRAVNIHMFCARRPGLLLSTMRALDSMGLDIQQAVISCFNGFALDIFRAEQSQDGPGVQPEEIKAALLHSAGLQGAIS